MVTAERPTATAPELITIRDAAMLLGTSRSALHYERLYGRLDAVRVPYAACRQGYRFMTTRESVARLKAERDARLEQKETPER